MASENLRCVRVGFAVPHGVPDAGPFEAEFEPPDTGEQTTYPHRRISASQKQIIAAATNGRWTLM